MSDIGYDPYPWDPTDSSSSLDSLYAPEPTITSASPYISTYQDNVRNLVTKHTNPAAYGAAADNPNYAPTYADAQRRNPNAIDALRRLDTRKVLNGGKAYGASDSIMGLRAAVSNEAQTQEPDQPIWQDFGTDLKALVTSIPKLPALAVQEGRDIGKLLTNDFHATDAQGNQAAAPTNAIESIGALAQLPGVRMLPGAFTVGAFGPGHGGVGELTDHPLFTALDVLPYANKAAEMSSTVKLARTISEPINEALGRNQRIKPISTFVQNWHPGGPVTEPAMNLQSRMLFPSELGLEQLKPNAFGAPIRDIGFKIRGTRIGNTLQEAFGPTVRDLEMNRHTALAEDYQYPLIDSQHGRFDQSNAAADAYVKAQDVASEAVKARFTKDQIHGMYDDVVNARNYDDLIDEYKAKGDPLALKYVQDNIDASLSLRQDKVDRGLLKPVEFEFPDPKDPNATIKRTEYLETPVADKVMAARAAQAEMEAGVGRAEQLKSIYTIPAEERPATAAQLMAEIPDIMRGNVPGTMAKKGRIAALRGNLAALEALGYDTSSLVDALKGGPKDIKTGKRPERPLDSNGRLEYHADKTFATAPPQFPVHDYQGAIDGVVNDLSRTQDPKAAILRSQLQSGDITGAKASIRSLQARKTFTYDVDWAKVNKELDSWNAVGTALDRFKKVGWSPESLTAANNALDKTHANAMPGRYAEFAYRAADEAFIRDVEAAVGGDKNKVTRIRGTKGEGHREFSQADLERVQDILTRDAIGELEQIGGGALSPDGSGLVDIYNTYVTDARKNWQKMAGEGVDPVYVHRISQKQGKAMLNPTVDVHVPGISSLKAKATSAERFAPQRDLAMSVTHDAHELLLRDASQRFVDHVTTAVATPADHVLARFKPEAEARSLASGRPYLDVLTELVHKHFVEFDPATGKVGGGLIPNARAADQFFIPREVGRAIERAVAEPGPLAKAFSRPMHIFRTAVLPLSPRWHVNNVVGGFILTAMYTGPGALKHVKRAWEMARGGEGLSRIPGAPAGGQLAQSAKWGVDMMHDLVKAPMADRLAASQSFYAGRAAGKLLDSVANTLGDRGISWITTATDAGTGLVKKSYNFNALFDDFYRSVAYLYGEDKAITKGMTKSQSTRAGVELSRKVLQDWDRMTPIERSVIRNIFPFYSWSAHILKVLSHYPADHPARLSIMAKLADNEWNDWQSGVPQKLRDQLFITDSKDGKVTGISMSGFNPFRDVSNYPALLGFLTGQEGGNLTAVSGQVNPFLQIAMQGMGMDPASGAGDLYPELEYDPTTGGMRAAQKTNAPFQFVQSLVPQSAAVFNMAGWNQDFADMVKTNPDAAARSMQSALGLPILWKNTDMDAEQIKAEITRYRAQMDARSAALKTGDMGELKRWPGLANMATQIEQLSATQRRKQSPNVQTPGLLDLVGGLAPGHMVDAG